MMHQCQQLGQDRTLRTGGIDWAPRSHRHLFWLRAGHDYVPGSWAHASCGRAEELYIGLAGDDPLDHRLWEALARLHGRRSDLLGLEATARRLRSALVELGEGEDPERVPVPPALERVFVEVRASLLNGQAA